MDLATRLHCVRDELEGMDTLLHRALAQNHLAMRALAEASRELPLLLTALPHLLTLEDDVATRLRRLQQVRALVDEVCDEADVNHLCKQVEVLSFAGLTSASVPTNRLN